MTNHVGFYKNGQIAVFFNLPIDKIVLMVYTLV